MNWKFIIKKIFYVLNKKDKFLLALILIVSFTLLFKRIQMLESENKIESVFCRENVFLAQNVLLVGIASTVLLGTVFPLLAEAVRGTKLSIQAPFFNTTIAPMGYMILFLMGGVLTTLYIRFTLVRIRILTNQLLFLLGNQSTSFQRDTLMTLTV